MLINDTWVEYRLKKVYIFRLNLVLSITLYLYKVVGIINESVIWQSQHCILMYVSLAWFMYTYLCLTCNIRGDKMYILSWSGIINVPSKHDTKPQCWDNVGATLAHHQHIIGWMLNIENEMCAQTSTFANVWSKIKQIWIIFIHLKSLWVAVARHNFK